MQKTLLFKTLIVGVLTFLIYIPLMMIQNTISERAMFRQEAVRSITADSVGDQTIIGPLLIIPYSEHYEETVTDEKTKKTTIVKHAIDRRLTVFPDELLVKGALDTDHRYRGIHKILIYSGLHLFSGKFTLPIGDDIKHEVQNSRLVFGNPHIALSIEDVRGVQNIPKITWNDQQSEFIQGSGMTAFKNGLHAPLARMELKQATSVAFSFELGLDGIESLRFAPLAKANQVTLGSKWPHPQFSGRFLPSPKTRTINDKGFSATWNISSLSSNAQQQLTLLENSNAAAPAATEKLDFFGVSLIEPINIYSQSERAVKYGLLFVALTFAAFFLFEVLKQLPIHPVQYTLVGLALALFFLLLVALSERIDFMTAYIIASTGCIVLIGFYLSFALHNWKRGFGFGVALTILYGILFGLLQSENNALVMGSILLFGVLAAIMITTRKVNWYQLGNSAEYGSAA